MKMKQLKQLFRLVYLSKRFPFVRLRQKRKALLVLVTENEANCRTQAEKVLYEKLRELGYYPTPRYEVGGFTINMALVPYRLALIEKTKNVDEKKLSRSMRKKGWSVLFYEDDKILVDTHDYLREIKQQARPTKNVSV
ncbi:hypothetical protein [Bacillus sp. LL01]|uniref:hypothetical protein n=1 Tax=Bacillus sp. LL01 TaxID=1665556 RepID=UPI001F521F58|nr:hypothetical protein [Bacillus sp. LL01]